MQNGGRADWREIKRVQDQIEKLWKQDEIFWGQRSRLKWLKWGDRNSSFFYATTVQRRDRNRLHRIKDKNGDWVEGQEDIFREILDHFSEVYVAEECVGIAECLQTVQPKVSQEMNKSLMAQVTDVEIKKAVDSLGASKAPGPDGLNEMFYQNHWEVAKEEVSEAIKEFFRGAEFPVEINETVVALAPKVALPESIHQLRPISCCNFMSKVIAKIIVHRLRGFMDGLISENQSAFIGGRQIQDNLVIAQELFYALKKKDKGGKEHLAINFDMSKAYDRLEWEFLSLAVRAHGFCEEWVNLVMKLVTTVSYIYKVNGYLSNKIIPKRGLRQGDPLSPYLFILAADVLSAMLSKAQSQGVIQGFRQRRGDFSLTHLFFADDSILFAKANNEEVFQLVWILNAYSRASGQKINLAKSGIICEKFVNPLIKEGVANILNMQCWDNPGNYLGLPAD